MAVITISRQYGSGGDEIVELIRKTTGFQIFDKQLIAEAAIDAGLIDQEVIDYSENNYKVKSLLERLFSGQRSVAKHDTGGESGGDVRVERLPLNEDNAVALVQTAIRYAHKLRNIVIVGRGGQVVLKDAPGVLHVRIVAPLEDRLLRVRSTPQFASHNYSDKVEARRAAQDLIETSDAASSGYLKQFYGVDWADPALYHLIVNTSKLDIDQSARAIIETARRLEGVMA